MRLNLKLWVEKALSEGYPKRLLEERLKTVFPNGIPDSLEFKSENSELFKQFARALFIPWGYLFLEPKNLNSLYHAKILVETEGELYEVYDIKIVISPFRKRDSWDYFIIKIETETGEYEYIEVPDFYKQEKPWEEVKLYPELKRRLQNLLNQVKAINCNILTEF